MVFCEVKQLNCIAANFMNSICTALCSVTSVAYDNQSTLAIRPVNCSRAENATQCNQFGPQCDVCGAYGQCYNVLTDECCGMDDPFICNGQTPQCCYGEITSQCCGDGLCCRSSIHGFCCDAQAPNCCPGSVYAATRHVVCCKCLWDGRRISLGMLRCFGGGARTRARGGCN